MDFAVDDPFLSILFRLQRIPRIDKQRTNIVPEPSQLSGYVVVVAMFDAIPSFAQNFFTKAQPFCGIGVSR